MKKRGKYLVPDSWREYSPDRGWIYVLGTDDGRVKVGRSRNIRTRFMQLRCSFKSVVWFHTFSPIIGRQRLANAESAAIKALVPVGVRIGRELFVGVDRWTAIRAIRASIVVAA